MDLDLVFVTVVVVAAAVDADMIVLYVPVDEQRVLAPWHALAPRALKHSHALAPINKSDTADATVAAHGMQNMKLYSYGIEEPLVWGRTARSLGQAGLVLNSYHYPNTRTTTNNNMKSDYD